MTKLEKYLDQQNKDKNKNIAYAKVKEEINAIDEKYSHRRNYYPILTYTQVKFVEYYDKGYNVTDIVKLIKAGIGKKHYLKHMNGTKQQEFEDEYIEYREEEHSTTKTGDYTSQNNLEVLKGVLEEEIDLKGLELSYRANGTPYYKLHSNKLKHFRTKKANIISKLKERGYDFELHIDWIKNKGGNHE